MPTRLHLLFDSLAPTANFWQRRADVPMKGFGGGWKFVASVSGRAGGRAGGRSAAFFGSDTGRRAGGRFGIMKAVDRAIGFCVLRRACHHGDLARHVKNSRGPLLQNKLERSHTQEDGEGELEA